MTILCTISLAISCVSHLFVLIFVQYRTISIAMANIGSQANETTNLQTTSFNMHLGRARIAGGASKQKSHPL